MQRDKIFVRNIERNNEIIFEKIYEYFLGHPKSNILEFLLDETDISLSIHISSLVSIRNNKGIVNTVFPLIPAPLLRGYNVFTDFITLISSYPPPLRILSKLILNFRIGKKNQRVACVEKRERIILNFSKI